MRRKPRQPLTLDSRVVCVQFAARHAHPQLISKVERRVVVTVFLDRPDLEICPLGKLVGHQPRDERCVDCRGVGSLLHLLSITFVITSAGVDI